MPRAPTPSSSRAADLDTRTQILDVAERLAQTRGFNGFSYADIAAELDLRKPSIHHHFPTKADLGEKLIARYAISFRAALATIDATATDAGDKLERYVAIYVDVLQNDRMCLCGMLAAELSTLPSPVGEGVRAFFVANEDWLARVLAEGKAAGALSFEGSPRHEARLVLATLEGAMLVARSFDDVGRFRAIAKRLLVELRGKA